VLPEPASAVTLDLNLRLTGAIADCHTFNSQYLGNTRSFQLTERMANPESEQDHDTVPPILPLETNFASSSGSDNASQDEEDDGQALLPRHTKVTVIGNNRTKQSLVGLTGVVKKAVGLGGWHWLVGMIC